MLMPIGQFSKVTRLSVKALRLYADNGLLSPTHVDSTTGYRYYDPALVRRAEMIRLMRLVGMPLEGIREVLDSKDVAVATGQLTMYRQQLMDRVATYDRLVLYLVSLMRHQETAMPYEVTVTQVPTRVLAAVRVHTGTNKIANDIPVGFGKLMQGVTRHNGRAAGIPMLIYHDVIDEDTEGDIEICVPVEQPFVGDDEVYGRELEGGDVATTLHCGPYEEISPAYHAVASWITTNGYQISGPPRELYLNDPRQVKPSELLTRVEFPVAVVRNGQRD